jgi:hypothetical protein
MNPVNRLYIRAIGRIVHHNKVCYQTRLPAMVPVIGSVHVSTCAADSNSQDRLSFPHVMTIHCCLCGNSGGPLAQWGKRGSGAVGPLRFRCTEPLDICGSLAGKELVVLSFKGSSPATESEIPRVHTITDLKQISLLIHNRCSSVCEMNSSR